ncbi:MAG: hypothetical protein JXB47_09395 [Anaerolineae bacterium]|nr:hypothetical protein [Anaerolineae bacterium]
MKRYLPIAVLAVLVVTVSVAATPARESAGAPPMLAPLAQDEKCNLRDWQINFVAFYDFMKAAEAAKPRIVEFDPILIPGEQYAGVTADGVVPVAIVSPPAIGGEIVGGEIPSSFSLGFGGAVPAGPQPAPVTIQLQYESMNESMGLFVLSMKGIKQTVLGSPGPDCAEPLRQPTVAWMSTVEKAFLAYMAGDPGGDALMTQAEQALQRVEQTYAAYGGTLPPLLALIGY